MRLVERMLSMTVDAKCSLRVTRHFDASRRARLRCVAGSGDGREVAVHHCRVARLRASRSMRASAASISSSIAAMVRDIDHVGEYLEIERPTRLVFTFAVPKYSPESTRVSIDIVPAGTGCKLTLTHEGVLPEWVSRTRGGLGHDPRRAARYRAANCAATNTACSRRARNGPLRAVAARADRARVGVSDRVRQARPMAGDRAKWSRASAAACSLTFDHAKPVAEDRAYSGAVQAERMQITCTHHKVMAYDPPRLLSLDLERRRRTAVGSHL